MTKNVKVISRNRKARHNFSIIEDYEAGLVLMGSEIKSIRAGKVNISEGFIQEDSGGDLWVLNIHIATYEQASIYGHEPLRPRKLLLHKKEIDQIQSRIREKGLTAVPLQLHLWRGRAKLQIGLAKGKRQYDKRETLKKRDADRQIKRALKDRY